MADASTGNRAATGARGFSQPDEMVAVKGWSTGARFRVRDILVGFAIASVLTASNILLGWDSGLSTFLPYDPIGAVMLAQSMDTNPFLILLSPFTQTSGLWVGGIAGLLRLLGEHLWVPYLMIFWPTALMLTVAAWLGRISAGGSGTTLFVLATALLPLLGHGIITPLYQVFSEAGIRGVFWSSLGHENAWQCWSCGVLKTDYLAGTFVMSSIALLAISPERVGVLRFLASGLAICLAILTKGHFALVYLFGWGAAMVTVALLLRERGPRFALTSYASLVLVLIPVLGTWWALGAADYAVAYIRDSFFHPLYGTNEYLKPEISMFSYILETSLSSIGFGLQVMALVALLALVAANGRFTPALRHAAPFFVAVCAMSLPYFVNTFGKNFTMVLPMHLTFWGGLLVLCGYLLATSRKERMRQYIIYGGIAAFAFVGTVAFGTAIASLPSKEHKEAIALDRAILEQISEAMIESEARTILAPLAYTGIPAIFVFEATKVARERGVPLPTIRNIGFDPNGGSVARERALNEILSFDAAIVIPGGPGKFPFLGAYLSHVYELTEKTVMAPDGPFVEYRSFRVPANQMPFVYFPSDGKEMEIKLYVRRELAGAN